MAAKPPVKNHPLHNFSLPIFKWGNKTHPNHTHRHRRSPPDNHRAADSDGEPESASKTRSTTAVPPGDGNGVVEVKEEEREGEARPWNLRPRRAEMGTTSLQKENGCSGGASKAARVRGTGQGHGLVGCWIAPERKSKLWISLSKDEIEEDVYALTGSRPARRPKRRPRTVQKNLDNVFPGLYLVGVTVDHIKFYDTQRDKPCC